MSDTAEYRDDDHCPGADVEKKLVMAVAGHDYFLQTVQVSGKFVQQERSGPMVRIRTSGSSDPRNLRVTKALRELWEALRDA